MRDLAVLFLHLLVTVARLVGPGGARAVVAESVLVKQQVLILNRARKRAPNLRPTDRVVAGLCALLIRPGQLIRSAVVIRPSTRHCQANDPEATFAEVRLGFLPFSRNTSPSSSQ